MKSEFFIEDDFIGHESLHSLNRKVDGYGEREEIDFRIGKLLITAEQWDRWCPRVGTVDVPMELTLSSDDFFASHRFTGCIYTYSDVVQIEDRIMLRNVIITGEYHKMSRGNIND